MVFDLFTTEKYQRSPIKWSKIMTLPTSAQNIEWKLGILSNFDIGLIHKLNHKFLIDGKNESRICDSSKRVILNQIMINQSFIKFPNSTWRFAFDVPLAARYHWLKLGLKWKKLKYPLYWNQSYSQFID